jgi:myo-inositol-1(or 4)-monophosphatase
MNDPSQLLSAATEIVVAAGKTIMGYFENTYQVRDKSIDNPVTDADLAADALLREGLTRCLPSAGWLSEETADDLSRLANHYTWIVDPLDGTKEFVLGIPEFTVSVALVAGDQPAMGIVYNPATSELYTCVKGAGVFLNRRRITVSDKSDLSGFIVGASRSERKRGEFTPFEDVIDLRTLGSIAYKLARVAAGQEDATWSRGPKNEWDICAGSLLVVEAGGQCRDLDGNPFKFNQPRPKVNGIIASNSAAFRQVKTLLQPHRHSARVD